MPTSLARLKDELRTGIDSVDRESRKLFAMIEELCDRFDSTASTSAVSGDFAALCAQAAAFFAAEERLLRQRNHAFYDAHKAEYGRLLRQICRMTEAYEDGSCAACGTDLRACFEAWLAGHVLNTHAAPRALAN